MPATVDRRHFLVWSGAAPLVLAGGQARAAGLAPRVLHALGPGDGEGQVGAPVPGPDGALYGCFMHGGSGGLGQVYRLSMSGEFTELVSMPYSDQHGFGPSGEPVFDANGALWAPTAFGGPSHLGTLLRYTAADGRSSWEPGATQRNGPGGMHSRLAASGGHWFGVADLQRGGNGSCVYRVPMDDPSRARVIARPHADGLGGVVSGPLPLPGGLLAGTTSGPIDHGGHLYRLDAQGGPLQILHQWQSAVPRGELLLGADGWIWGVVSANQARHKGQVWRFHPRHGRLQVVHAFGGGEDGAFPCGGLALHPDGSLWGLTNGGGDIAMPRGTHYRISPSGGYQGMHRFSEDDPCGFSPLGAPGIAPDGSVVGCTSDGGAHGRGTLFVLDY